MIATANPADHLDIIRTVRDARCACGIACPHCGSRSIVRWGHFSGRQRYRCRTCAKTFSDLTRTAFAYTKKITKWPHYLVLVRRSQTLRSAAARLDIHVSTAFRWRHRLLSHMSATDATTLNGTVELKEILFAHSNKGCRQVYEPRKRGGRFIGWRWNECPRDRVLLAVSRTGGVHSAAIGGGAVVADDVRTWALRRLSGRCTIFGSMPRAGACASPIRGAGHDYHLVSVAPFTVPTLTPEHTLNVRAYERRLLHWLRTFRGVASRYREHYLLWHRRVDVDTDLLWARGAIVESLEFGVEGRSREGRLSCTDRPP